MTFCAVHKQKHLSGRFQRSAAFCLFHLLPNFTDLIRVGSF